MSTPICDFVRRYAGGGAVRMHMPGHKGCGPLGCEALDITEIDGADDLFHPEGIIAQSEENAGAIFGAHTLYATGGKRPCCWRGVMPTRHSSMPPLCWTCRCAGSVRRRERPITAGP